MHYFDKPFICLRKWNLEYFSSKSCLNLCLVMGSLLIDQIKKQASSFLQEKFKTARLTFTDVTEAEL